LKNAIQAAGYSGKVKIGMDVAGNEIKVELLSVRILQGWKIRFGL
jgi:hypothetical protein